MGDDQNIPFVSVIIPVYNDYEALTETLETLQNQKDYQREKYEIIVVDNGSGEDHLVKIRKLQNIRFLEEHTYIQSPYSARNRGLEIARGEIIVLLDATCRPVNDWLCHGIQCLKNLNADIIGGEVSFDFENQITSSKIVDSVTSIRMEQVIKERNVAKTANLFIKREVFDKIGPFPEGIRSGGDVRWTGKATSRGFKLKFCEGAKVFKKARGFKALTKKKWRTGIAQPENWKDTGENESVFRILYRTVKPPNPSYIKKMLMGAGYNTSVISVFNAWFVYYLMGMTFEVAKLVGMINRN